MRAPSSGYIPLIAFDPRSPHTASPSDEAGGPSASVVIAEDSGRWALSALKHNMSAASDSDALAADILLVCVPMPLVFFAVNLPPILYAGKEGEHIASNTDFPWPIAQMAPTSTTSCRPCPSVSPSPRGHPFPISRSLRGCACTPRLPTGKQHWCICSFLSLAAAILYFDFFLTLPAEVDRYWTGNGCSWASLLFFMNRYMSIFCHIPIIYEFFWSMPESVRPPVLANFALYCSLKSKH